jgi:hypothetical protein
MAYGFSINADGNAINVVKQVEDELAKLGVEAKINVEKAESAMSGFQSHVKGIFGELKGIIAGGLLAGGIWGGMAFIEQSKEAYDNLEKSVVRVNTVLASTKGAAGLSGEAIESQAKALGKSIVNGRAEIMDAQGMLLSFTQIKGPVFGAATKAVADFATFYKTDMTSAALSIGKALNDPLKGMTKLQRQGVTFTDEQKKQVKLYLEQGKLAAAQGVILKELQTEFGGQAAAFANTDEGKIAMAKKQWGEIKLTIGEIVSKLTVALIPAFTAMVNVIKQIYTWLTGTSTSAEIFKDVILVVGAALLVYEGYVFAIAAATKIWTAVQWALDAALNANPIGLIVAGVIALITVIVILWDKCKTFREIVGGVFGYIKEYVMTLVHVFMNLGKIIADVFTGHFSQALTDGKKMIMDFGHDIGPGMVKAIQKGADDAGNSTFKFGNLLKFGTGQEGPSKELKGGPGGAGSGIKDNAINTSNLSGAKGGLGEAKIIKMDFHAPLVAVNLSDSSNIKNAAGDAAEFLLRTLNNVAYSQSQTM